MTCVRRLLVKVRDLAQSCTPSSPPRGPRLCFPSKSAQTCCVASLSKGEYKSVETGRDRSIWYFGWIFFKLSLDNLLDAKKEFLSFCAFLFFFLLFQMQTLVAKYNSRRDRQSRSIWTFGWIVFILFGLWQKVLRTTFFSFGALFFFSLLEQMQLCLAKQHSQRKRKNEFICIFCPFFSCTFGQKNCAPPPPTWAQALFFRQISSKLLPFIFATQQIEKSEHRGEKDRFCIFGELFSNFLSTIY